jgi:enamine deaminase RidA (YjgF/YER057c/UK114 family)
MSDQQPNVMFRKTSVHDDLLFVAGATPRQDGVMKFVGTVGRDLSVVEAQEAARLAVRNALREVASTVETLGAKVTACHRMTVYSVVEDSAVLTEVANAASEQLIESLGREALGVRTAIGVAMLPGRAPVEVELTLALER